MENTIFYLFYLYSSYSYTTYTYIISEFKKLELEMFNCSLIDREVFRAICSFGNTIENLDPNEVSGKDKAIANILPFTEEV